MGFQLQGRNPQTKNCNQPNEKPTEKLTGLILFELLSLFALQVSCEVSFLHRLETQHSRLVTDQRAELRYSCLGGDTVRVS